MTNPQVEDEYISTDARELAAYYQSQLHSHSDEVPEGYEEDMDILRGVM